MNESVAAPEGRGPRRRGLLLAGVGVAAAFVGAGVAWRRFSESPIDENAAGAIWPLAFDRPEGGRLVMASLRGKPLLLNFWATWCPPCVEEMPMLDGFFRQNVGNGWQVVGLAIDQPAPVRSFLGQRPVSFPIGLAAAGGQELSRALGNLDGGLPFTVIVDAAGRVAERRMGRVSTAELSRWRELK